MKDMLKDGGKPRKKRLNIYLRHTKGNVRGVRILLKLLNITQEYVGIVMEKMRGCKKVYFFIFCL